MQTIARSWCISLALLSSQALAAAPDCAAITDARLRLACYDRAAARQLPAHEPATVPPAERRDGPCARQGWHTGPRVRSPLAWRWDLDRCEPARSVFLPHRPNYFLPVIYTDSVNRDVWDEAGAGAARDAERFRHYEAAFQLSFKVRLLRDVLSQPVDIWAAYTQRSFWQVYSTDVSAPVRETNYEPELIAVWRPAQTRPGLPRHVSLGLNHQSNGRSDALSRSWNRLYLEAGFDGPDYMLALRPWWRLPTEDRDSDTPALENWAGRVQVLGAWQWRRHVFSAEIHNNLLWPNNRGNVQLGWTWPLTDRVKAYVQVFDGHGLNLLDYRHDTRGVAAGLLLGDWL